jgi:Mycothiol maleylpyruvate isomerase N-terminal domain
MTDSRTTFLSAARSYVAQVGRIPVDALAGPGLGDWDLRALVGHTSRSLVTVDTYLDQPADEVAVPTAADYYLAIAEIADADRSAVTERGRSAGEALGDDPAGFVRELLTRVGARLATYEDGSLLTTIAGGMRLDEYLRTRTFELVVHGFDIAVACGVDPAFEPAPQLDASALAAQVAVLTGRTRELLLAVTGRAGLPDGFSIV